MTKGDVFHLQVGISYDNMEINQKIEIYSQGLLDLFKQRLFYYVPLAIILTASLTGIWGIKNYFSMWDMSDKLEITESRRIQLSRDIEKLIKKKPYRERI